MSVSRSWRSAPGDGESNPPPDEPTRLMMKLRGLLSRAEQLKVGERSSFSTESSGSGPGEHGCPPQTYIRVP